MHKVGARIMQILGISITCLFILMTIIGTCRIVTRYFFSKPSIVSEGLLTYSFTRMVLLASAYAPDKRDRMRVGFLVDKISGLVKKYLEVIADLLTFAFAGVVMVYGGTSITKLTVIQTTVPFRVPMGYICVAIFMTGITIMMFSLMNVADMLHMDLDKKKDVGV